MAKRKQIEVTVKLSVKPGITKSEAKRELKSRVNDACCYRLDEEDVKIRSMR